MSSCVEFIRISKSYVAGEKILDDIDLELPAGVTTAVVGASGSGKTTLLQLVNALVLPDSGQIQVFGEAIPDDLVAFRRQIGYSVQGAGLFPHLTNRENVVLLAKLEGWSDAAIRARYRSLLEDMGLSMRISDRYPVELSGGQQQRVGLCRALMLRPRLLLLDEPFAAIDPLTRVEIQQRFQFIQGKTDVSTLLVTHDMHEAVKLANWLVILHRGRIAQAGPTHQVLSAPNTGYVSRLLEEQLQ